MKTKTTLSQFKKWKFFLLSIPLMLCSHASMAQTQVGSDIDGEAAGDISGSSVSMPDAYTVAIGAQYNDGNGTESDHVRVYKWNGNT